MPKKILLADDSITIQKVVELTFSDGDYEVTAVNNGAKAVQKLADMRPDIILSDIIMPEKNGYEVCEFIKSHPEYRNIPVVLLTGTFEPFDPDRAEKAGCDAVVTKPFESQSLIHKVEELIAQARSAAAAPPPAPAPVQEAASPWMDEPGTPAEPPPADDPFAAHGGDIFDETATPASPTTEMPFDAPPPAFDDAPAAYGGETRAFPKMSFDDFAQAEAPQPEPPAVSEPSPWDEQPAFGGETQAFPRMSFDDLQAMANPPAAPSTPSYEPPAYEPPAFETQPEPEAESPFGAPPPAEEFSGETRAFPRMSFEELSQMANAPAPPVEPEPPAAPETPFSASEASPWDEPPAFGGETRAFPKMSFEELSQMANTPAPEPPPAAPETPLPASETPLSASEPSPWDEQPAFGGETRAFPKMTFDELQQMASTPAAEPEPPQPEPAPWDEPAEPSWAAPEPPQQESYVTSVIPPFSPEPEPEPEPMPFAAEPEPEPAPAPPQAIEQIPSPPVEPSWAPAQAAAAEPALEELAPPPPPPPALAPETPALSIRGSELSDEQVDRIARRVVELMSDQIVRNIAWEVIPDMCEMVVKERIRQLEAQD